MDAAQAAVLGAKQLVGEFMTQKRLQLQEVVQKARDGSMAALIEEKRIEMEILLKQKTNQISQALTNFSVLSIGKSKKNEEEKQGALSQI
jgi:hypothetical protein